MQSIEIKIVMRIQGMKRGWCFTPRHFLDLGSNTAIKMALSRLAAKGIIRRLARGLYDFPKKHSVIGLLAPSPYDVARALSRTHAIRLQSTGAYAANLLGLSEQVPAKVVFLTDGPAKCVKIGKEEIILKNTTPRNMATAGRISGTVIQALRHLGKSQVTNQHIAQLKKTLNDNDKKQLKKDSIYSPVWLHPIIEKIVSKDNNND
jgi:predicted transcriptional regulator of viral defense system